MRGLRTSLRGSGASQAGALWLRVARGAVVQAAVGRDRRRPAQQDHLIVCRDEDSLTAEGVGEVRRRVAMARLAIAEQLREMWRVEAVGAEVFAVARKAEAQPRGSARRRVCSGQAKLAAVEGFGVARDSCRPRGIDQGVESGMRLPVVLAAVFDAAAADWQWLAAGKEQREGLGVHVESRRRGGGAVVFRWRWGGARLCACDCARATVRVRLCACDCARAIVREEGGR